MPTIHVPREHLYDELGLRLSTTGYLCKPSFMGHESE